MGANDRQKWNDKWAGREVGTSHSSSLVKLVTDHVAGEKRLLDVAGGGSSDAIELARNWFKVTVVDVSDVGLSIARDNALMAGVEISTIEADLDSDPFPAGPWDVITSANFLQRNLIPAMIDTLVPGGWLFIVVATVTNLERHERPGRPFLVEPGELPDLATGLEIVHHSEAWRANGRHESHLAARKPSPPPSRPPGFSD